MKKQSRTVAHRRRVRWSSGVRQRVLCCSSTEQGYLSPLKISNFSFSRMCSPPLARKMSSFCSRTEHFTVNRATNRHIAWLPKRVRRHSTGAH